LRNYFFINFLSYIFFSNFAIIFHFKIE
jgi:hypothetical protein